LQAMLLPSANNFADTLATWAFGSLDKYIEYANSYVQSLGMKDTHVADASGFSPQTMSSTRDLVLLGEAAIKNPVVADIVNQQQASVPVAGVVKNTNWLLGTDNVVGIKTGNTGEAGGCYLFASKRKIDNKDITVVGAIMGAPQLNNAVSDSRPLIAAMDKGFKTITAVAASQNIGYYQLPWGGKVDVVSKDALAPLTWQGQKVELTAKLKPTKAPQAKETSVGSINTYGNQKTLTSKAILAQKIPAPSWHWRIFNR
jgi:D-alanyl-D-alanine carboxypeptidase (penicillin-binding protein 5/6)